MLMRRLAITLLSAGVAVGGLSVGAGPAMAAGGHVGHDTELHATMNGTAAYAAVRGSADYGTDHQGRHLELHLNGAQRLAGKTLVIYVHGVKAGLMSVSRAGYAHMDRHGAPLCMSGQQISVRTTPGAVVATGTLRTHHMHD